MFTRPAASVFTDPAYVGIGSNVVVPQDSRGDLWNLACLLNSTVSAFWWRENGKQRGAGVDVGVDRLRGFPLPRSLAKIDECITLRLLASIIAFITQSLESAESTVARQSTRDPLMLAYWERVLNGMVYELYFPEEVHGAGIGLFDLVERCTIPDINTVAESQRLTTLRDKFEDLYDPNHSLRITLDRLHTLDTVRIIEGKE